MSSVFPKWSNALPLKLIVFLLILAAAVVSGVTYYATPNYTRVGYEPSQPVPYNHSFHVGELGLDCRYCHSKVEVGPCQCSRGEYLYVLSQYDKDRQRFARAGPS